MGTDNIGRDIFAQVMQGGRVSLAVGVIAMLIALFVGTLVGVLAGYFRRLDGLLMRLTDLFLALPLLPLLLVIIMLFRDTLRGDVRAGDRDLPADRLHHRHHPLDADRAHRPRRRAGAEGARVRAGGEVDRHAEPADHHPAHPAERAVADHGLGDPRHRQRDHHRERAVASSASASRPTSRPGGGCCSTARTS